MNKVQTQTVVRLNGQVMENVRSFKYLGGVMSKVGSLDNKVRERIQQGRRVVGKLKAVRRNKAMSMEVKRTLHDSVVIPTLTYSVKHGQ